MEFSNRFSEILKSCQYTQKQIAQKLGISEGNLSNWKKGTNLPSIDILYKLCVILDVSADYLLGLEDYAGTKTYVRDSFNNFTNTGNFKI